MNNIQIINLTPENIADYGVCGYKDVQKHKELRNKISWFNTYYPKGLRIKVLYSSEGGYQGMLEYIPGRYAHRPVDAEEYMFIHCLFVGFKKEYKGRGFASMMLDECIQEAKKEHCKGVAVVTRKGSFMADDAIFLKKGFEVVDKTAPDFSLLVLKFDKTAENPCFRSAVLSDLSAYKNGLTVLRSAQCPYTEKNVQAILETASKKYKLQTRLIDLQDAASAQNCPCAFGTFCLIYQGQVISHHPISNARFENIMAKLV